MATYLWHIYILYKKILNILTVVKIAHSDYHSGTSESLRLGTYYPAKQKSSRRYTHSWRNLGASCRTSKVKLLEWFMDMYLPVRSLL
jgi:hypothetical protein